MKIILSNLYLKKNKTRGIFNLLSGGKETIRIKTNSESKTTKPDNKEAKFQNGYSAVCQKSSEIRGLAVFNRPNRRLYAYSSLGMPQDVSAIQNKGKRVPISGDSIWANVSSSNFHKYASSGGSKSKDRRGSCVPILRRLVDTSSEQKLGSKRCTNVNSSVRKLRSFLSTRKCQV